MNYSATSSLTLELTPFSLSFPLVGLRPHETWLKLNSGPRYNIIGNRRQLKIIMRSFLIISVHLTQDGSFRTLDKYFTRYVHFPGVVYR